jgi:hypothetical protein
MAKKTPVRTKARPSQIARHLRKKAASKKAAAVRHSQRKWHVRLTLHPVSIFMSLCVGVLLVAATLASFGDSYSVTASIPTPPLTSAAIITDPTDGSAVTNEVITVIGSCPASSYVDVTVNGTLAGISNCTNNLFQVPASLEQGPNQITAQDYNVLNVVGPSSASITVAYSIPEAQTAPPAAAPIALDVTEEDTEVPYIVSAVQVTTQTPIFEGVAPPYSQVDLLFHSNPVTCITTADSLGNWRCQLTSPLPVGYHTVLITAKTPSGVNLSVPLIHFRTRGTAEPIQVKPVTPLSLAINYQYQVYMLHKNVPFSFTIVGGTAPYVWTINWDDGTSSTTAQSNNGLVTLNHTYNTLPSKLGTFNIKVQAVDADGDVTTTQVIAVVRNPNYVAPVASTSVWQRTLSTVHPWLWILWPGYAIILLMTVSFWLGERKQLLIDRKTRKIKRVAHRKTRRHA